MATISDLFQATKNTYDLFKRTKKDICPDGFVQVRSEHNKDSDHSAVAYYNADTKEVIIAHRGSVTRKDWFKTDFGIAAGVPQTAADKSAIQFSIDVLDYLQEQSLDVKKILQTGHSKGGHEAQVCAAFLANSTEHDVECITFNAPGLHHSNKKEGVTYKHKNIRVAGGKLKFGDIVSKVGGPHLGENTDMSLTDYEFHSSSHTMGALESAFKNGINETIFNMSASGFIEISKGFKNIGDIYNNLVSINSTLFENKPIIIDQYGVHSWGASGNLNLDHVLPKELDKKKLPSMLEPFLEELRYAPKSGSILESNLILNSPVKNTSEKNISFSSKVSTFNTKEIDLSTESILKSFNGTTPLMANLSGALNFNFMPTKEHKQDSSTDMKM